MSKIEPIRMACAEFRIANQKPGNFKFCAPFNVRTLIGRNLVAISNRAFKRSDEAEIKSVHSGIFRLILGIKGIKIQSIVFSSGFFING